ncbi:MAG: GNAT family N-acetyltransferase [Candidatus Accumulibacter sp.]|jgi:GNAT superfamily N-acetyltransferase|nr:GNAT family N-acetyltransferase [Accumulibacter sp.]
MAIRMEPLQAHHDTEAFGCGDDALDGWLRRIAKQHLRKGISRSFVAVESGNFHRVLGFYSLTVGEVDADALPSAIAKKLPRKIPIVLIGRLGVLTEAQGRGIGGYLLVDALHRALRVSSEVGIIAVLVDAKNKNAVNFYRHHGFLQLPDRPQRLILPIRTAISLFEIRPG